MALRTRKRRRNTDAEAFRFEFDLYPHGLFRWRPHAVIDMQMTAVPLQNNLGALSHQEGGGSAFGIVQPGQHLRPLLREQINDIEQTVSRRRRWPDRQGWPDKARVQ